MTAFIKSALATLAFAALHSALASSTAKRAAGQLVGERRRDAAYRACYVAQGTLTFAGLVAYGATLPQNTIYRLRGPAALVLRLGQLAGGVQLLLGMREIGFARWAGIPNLVAYRRGHPIPVAPVAQGPELTDAGAFTTGGPFRWSRHPLNLAAVPIFWFTPHLTTRRLAFNLVGTAYLLLGSAHEEKRLRDAYGQTHRDYASSGVPFFWPSHTGNLHRAQAADSGRQRENTP